MRSSAILPSAISSSIAGAREIHQPKRWARIRASSPSIAAYCATSSGALIPELRISSAEIAVPKDWVVAESAAANPLIGEAPLRSWCSTWRGGRPCPWRTRRIHPWNLDQLRRWLRKERPIPSCLHGGGCRDPGHCAAPSWHQGRAKNQRGRGRDHGRNEQRPPT